MISKREVEARQETYVNNRTRLVKEVHPFEEDKLNKLSNILRSNSKKVKMKNESTSTDFDFKQRKWKPNSMLPPPKNKRPPVDINYLENKRRMKGDIEERENTVYKSNNWKEELKDK